MAHRATAVFPDPVGAMARRSSESWVITSRQPIWGRYRRGGEATLERRDTRRYLNWWSWQSWGSSALPLSKTEPADAISP
eukprot:scaffold10056_cov93-Isochrysis_galbana.AAC.4